MNCSNLSVTCVMQSYALPPTLKELFYLEKQGRFWSDILNDSLVGSSPEIPLPPLPPKEVPALSLGLPGRKGLQQQLRISCREDGRTEDGGQ